MSKLSKRTLNQDTQITKLFKVLYKEFLAVLGHDV